MSLIYAQMGMKVLSSVGSYRQQKHEARMAEISRKYNETMSGISAAMQLNTMTQNEIQVRDATIRTKAAIDVQSLQDKGAAAADAAASGVAGGSVTSAMRGLTRSHLTAKHAVRKQTEAQARAQTQDRRNIALARALQKDVSVIPQPSAASAMLGLGASLVDIYDSHQPEGSQISDHLARLGR